MRALPKSKALFERAKSYIPGGVNSPVRAFQAVGGTPPFISHAKGAYLYDEDGHAYIDLFNAWGPMLLGHAWEQVTAAAREALQRSPAFGMPTGAEVEMAALLVQAMPAMDMVRMVNSGTEATLSALRLARAYTGRQKVITFEGCYHGHSDAFLVAAGSGVATMSLPASAGISTGAIQDTLVLPYNDMAAVDACLEAHEGELAAIIVEPVAGNMGCVLPAEGFLEGLRRRCDEQKIVLIFDEVMTGFRLALGGAQGLYGVFPDLSTLGKIIGGGLPVGAYGGRKDIMAQVSPQGSMYQAGTLSGNPVVMACGHALLTHLCAHPEVYDQLAQRSQQLRSGTRDILQRLGLPYAVQGIGAMFSLFFCEQGPVQNFEDAKKVDHKRFADYFHGMLSEGIFWPSSPFESAFLSTAVDESLCTRILEVQEKVLRAIH